LEFAFVQVACSPGVSTIVETVFAISGVVNSASFSGAFDRCP